MKNNQHSKLLPLVHAMLDVVSIYQEIVQDCFDSAAAGRLV